MNSLHCCQQLARTRKPTKIHIHMLESGYDLDHHSWLDVKESYECAEGKSSPAFSADMIHKWTPEVIGTYKKLVYKTEYIDGVLSNLHYHTIDILTKKGHTIQMCNESEKGTGKITNKEYHNIKAETMEKLLSNLEPKDRDMDKVKIYQTRMSILGIGHLDYDQLNDHQKQVIYDEHSFKCWMRFKLLRNRMKIY